MNDLMLLFCIIEIAGERYGFVSECREIMGTMEIPREALTQWIVGLRDGLSRDEIDAMLVALCPFYRSLGEQPSRRKTFIEAALCCYDEIQESMAKGELSKEVAAELWSEFDRSESVQEFVDLKIAPGP